jgi:hypothetical protein
MQSLAFRGLLLLLLLAFSEWPFSKEEKSPSAGEIDRPQTK